MELSTITNKQVKTLCLIADLYQSEKIMKEERTEMKSKYL